MSGKKIAIYAVAGLLIAGIGGGVGYLVASQLDDDTPAVVTPVDSKPEPQQPQPNEPKPEPTTPSEPTKQPDTSKPEPKPTTPPPAQQPSDVISVRAFQGSGSLPLTDKGLKNNAFEVERLDWSDTHQTLHVIGKMRVFEAVGYVRVRDENKEIVEPERVIRAAEGAPAWSPFEAQIPLLSEYKGKTLLVEFYEKSANDGSRVNMLTFKIKPE